MFLTLKRKKTLIFSLFSIALISMLFTASSSKGFSSLRYLNQENLQSDKYLELRKEGNHQGTHENSLSFYLENMIEKNRRMLTNYLIDENDLQNILSKIKCIWLDNRSYLVYNFYAIDYIMNQK